MVFVIVAFCKPQNETEKVCVDSRIFVTIDDLPPVPNSFHINDRFLRTINSNSNSKIKIKIKIMDGDPTMIELEGSKRIAPIRRIPQEKNKTFVQEDDSIRRYDDLGDIPMVSPTNKTTTKMVQQSISNDTTGIESSSSFYENAHFHSDQDDDNNNDNINNNNNNNNDDEDESFHSFVKQPETPPPIRRLIDTTTPPAIIPVSIVPIPTLQDSKIPSIQPQQYQQPMIQKNTQDQNHDIDEMNDEELEQIHENFQNDTINNDNSNDDDNNDDASTSARQCDDDAQEINRVRTIREDVSKHQDDEQYEDTTTTTTTTFDDNLTTDATMETPDKPIHNKTLVSSTYPHPPIIRSVTDDHDHDDNTNDDDDDESLLRGTPTEFDDNTTMDTSVNSNVPVVDLASDGFSSFLMAAGLAMEEAVCGPADEDSLLDQSSMDEETEITEFEVQEDDIDQEPMQQQRQHVFDMPQDIVHCETHDTRNEKNTLSNVLMDGVVSIGMGVIAVGAAVGAAFDHPESTSTSRAKEKYAADNYPSEEWRQDQEHDLPSEHFNSRTVSTKSRYNDDHDRFPSQELLQTVSSEDCVDIDYDEEPVDSDNYHASINGNYTDDDHVDYDGDNNSDFTSTLRLETPLSEGIPSDDDLYMIPSRSMIKSDRPQNADFATIDTEDVNNSLAVNAKMLMVRAQMTDELNRLFREVELYEMGVNSDDDDTDDYGPPNVTSVAPTMSPKGQWNDSVKPGNELGGADIGHMECFPSLTTTTQEQYPRGKFDDDPTMAIVTGSVATLGGAPPSYGAGLDDDLQRPKTYFDEDPAMSECQDLVPPSDASNNSIDDDIDLENPPPLQFKYPGMAIHYGSFLKDSSVRPDKTDTTENDITVTRDACKVVGYNEPARSWRKAPWSSKDSMSVHGKRPQCRRRCIFIGVTILFTLLILVLAIGFGSGSFGGGKKNGSSSSAIGDPDLSTAPTSAPTMNAEERRLAFAKLFMLITLDGGKSFNGTSSPESLAYNWIVNQDVLKLNPSDMSTKNQMRIVQRYGLSTIYFNSAKTSWTNESKWLGMNECEWFGITCGTSDEVIGINLFNNLLVGTLSHDIATLTNLEELNLSANNIDGSLPASIASMGNLRVLAVQENNLSGDLSGVDFSKMSSLNVFDCRRNSFKGEIPDALYQASLLSILALDSNYFSGSLAPEISTLVVLERFTASRNGFNGTLPTTIGLLTSLQVLRLGENAFSGTIPSEVGTMSALNSFDIFTNAINGRIPTEFGMLRQLQFMFLSRNFLESGIPSELGLIESLVGFFVNDNLLTGTIPLELGKNDKLQVLRLGKNSFTSGPIPSFLYQMTSLTEVHMYGINMTGNFSIELGNLNSLSSLRVEDNLLTGSLPSEVSRLVNLTELIISANTLTGSIPSSIGSLTLLTDLRLDQNQFFGLLPDAIGNMVFLETLQFDNNLLFGQLPDTFTNLVNLKLLYCGNNQLSGTFPENFGNLVALEDFQCFHNTISQSRQPGIRGTLPTSLGKMSNLKTFIMYQNGLKGTIPTFMGEMSSLEFLDVEWNLLSGTVPTELGKLSNLGTLHLGGNNIIDPLPLSLCSLSLDVYTVDCNMNCTCCTQCGARVVN